MFWINCMAWSASVWIQTGGTRRVTWVYLTSCLKMSWNSTSCMNNSASRLKIALDSVSLFLGSASLVEEFQYLLVEPGIGESRDDSVSCVQVESELLDSASLGVARRFRSRIEGSPELGDSASHRVDSTSRVSQGLTLTLSLTKGSPVVSRGILIIVDYWFEFSALVVVQWWRSYQ